MVNGQQVLITDLNELQDNDYVLLDTTLPVVRPTEEH